MVEASVAIQVLPKVGDTKEVVRIVDKVIEYIDSTHLKYFVGPFETTIEGDYDTLMDIVKECQLICLKEGAPGVSAYVKISLNPAGVLTIDEKTAKYQGEVICSVIFRGGCNIVAGCGNEWFSTIVYAAYTH